eukprot:6211434-Pleurochrysis_carterae.AAC.2
MLKPVMGVLRRIRSWGGGGQKYTPFTAAAMKRQCSFATADESVASSSCRWRKAPLVPSTTYTALNASEGSKRVARCSHEQPQMFEYDRTHGGLVSAAWT